ncbi:MAG: DUF4136 domain-containing protein [Candidatus Acidiferrum sp.]
MQAKLYSRILALALAMSFLLVVAGAVSAQQVTYNFMPGVDFTQFHTYKWVEIPGGIHPNQIVDQEIKQAVNSTLAGKGFTMVTGDAKADLYVGYQCFIQQQRQWNAWGMGGGLRWGGMGSATSSTIDNGTLAVDFYNPTSQELLWRGSAAQTLDPSGNQNKNMQKLDKAMNKLLKNFPPPQKK